MPEYLRTLVVVVLFANVVFYFARRNKAIFAAQDDHLNRRVRLWLLFTMVAFLAHNFWIYALVVAGGLIAVRSKELNSAALFYFLLFLLPAASIQVPGFGAVNYLFDLDHIRLLSLTLLLPAWLKLRKSASFPSFGRFLPDKILALYLVVLASLMLARSLTLTSGLRSIFGLFIDVYLPYMVFSRALCEMRDFKDTLSSYAISAAIIGIVGMFEVVRHWLLYRPVVDVLGLKWSFGYLGREGLLRASASAGQPIALGFAMVVAMGFYFFLIKGKSKSNRLFGGVLAGGLIAPLSRGPWVGFVALIFAHVVSGRNALSKLTKLFFVGMMIFVLLLALPGGKRVIDFLPFIGSVETGGIDYRQRLINNSLIVIQQNPLFGSANFLETPEMQELLQGEGIIDVTNTYLAIALNFGLSALFLFVTFFGGIIISIYKCIKQNRDDDEMHLLGQSLLAVLIGILTMLATVSSITVIPTIYWTVAGLSVAYIQFSKKSSIRRRIDVLKGG